MKSQPTPSYLSSRLSNLVGNTTPYGFRTYIIWELYMQDHSIMHPTFGHEP